MDHPDEQAEEHRLGSAGRYDYMDHLSQPGQSCSSTTEVWVPSSCTAYTAASALDNLNTAMSRLTAKDIPITWNCTAFGTLASGVDIVQIRWKSILMDVVRSLGGTEPVYIYDETIEGLFQTRVSFNLFFYGSRSTSRHVDVTGMKQPTLFQAQDEASFAALKQLQLGFLNTRIVDVSHNYCKEMEKRCHMTLTNATSLYHIVKQVLLDWENFMHNAEAYYRPSHQNAVETKCHATFRIDTGIRTDVADQLFILMRVSYLEQRSLISATEETKDFIERVFRNGKHFFFELSADKINMHGGALPKETELCMKLVLEEMMMALGWPTPTFSISGLSSGLYVCQTSLFRNNSHVCAEPRILTIFGDEALSADAAVQSSCKAAISALEAEMSICLLDLNYYHRSAAKELMVKSEEAAKSVTLVGDKILAQWEVMVNEIQACQQHCLNLAGEHKARHQGTVLYDINHNSVRAVTELHEVCLAGFLRAKDRLKTGLK